MRLSRWVPAVAFSLGLVAVAGWLALAQDDGDADPAAGGDGGAGAGIHESSGDATIGQGTRGGARGDAAGGLAIEPGDVEAGDDADRLSTARGLRGEGLAGTTIDLDPLGDLRDFGLRGVTGDVEVRSGVLDAVLRESALLTDLGTDEILGVDRTEADRDRDRADGVLSGAAARPIDRLDPGSLEGLLADRHRVDLGMLETGAIAADATSDVKLDGVLDDLDGLTLLADRTIITAVLDRVDVGDLYAGAVLGDLAVVELGAPFTASAAADAPVDPNPSDAGTLDAPAARGGPGRPGGFDRLDRGTLDDLDRLDGVDVLDRLDGRAWPGDLTDLDLVVLEGIDSARPGVPGGLDPVGLFDLGALGLRDGPGLGPP